MRTTLVICFVGLLIATAAGLAQGQTVFFDTFRDGDAEDGMPVTWVPAGDPGEIYDASSGDYMFTAAPGQGNPFAEVPDVTFTDTSIRTQGRVTTIEGTVGVAARNQQLGNDFHGYFAGAGYFPDSGGTAMFLARQDGSGLGNVTFFGDFPVLPFDVRTEDVAVQLDVIGNQLSAWAWRAGGPMPATPQLTGVDSAYGSGWVRIFAGNGVNEDNTTTFRYVHVASSHIPEPSTAIMAALAAVGFVVFRRRQR